MQKMNDIIKDLDVYQNSWNYGMQKIAERVIAEAYGINDIEVPITSADFKNLKFKGYNPMNMNESFKVELKLVPKISFKKGA